VWNKTSIEYLIGIKLLKVVKAVKGKRDAVP